MPDDDKDNGTPSSAWKYFRPRGGFSKGTQYGLLVCAAIVTLLFLCVYVLGAPPGTGQAALADALLGLLLAVAGVWVVGGTIELKTTLYDVSVKAGGGIAILLLVAVFVRPIYYASGQVEYAENIALRPWGTVGDIILHYNEQFAQMLPDRVRIELPDDVADKVLNFRATNPPDVAAAYKANWGFPRRNPKLRVLDEIAARQNCLSFEGDDATVVAILDERNLKELVADDGRMIYVCKQG